MFSITLSDLLYRRRQFLIAILGAALVFAMTLLLAGLTAGFGVEINQTVGGFRRGRLGGRRRLVGTGHLADADGGRRRRAGGPDARGDGPRRPSW